MDLRNIRVLWFSKEGKCFDWKVSCSISESDPWFKPTFKPNSARSLMDKGFLIELVSHGIYEILGEGVISKTLVDSWRGSKDNCFVGV